VWGIGIFTFIPSYSTARKQAPRLHRAQFGDRAFAVREKEGINHNGQVWDLVFTDVPKSVAEEISNFIQGNKGTTPFTWVTPDGDTLSFVCSGVRLTGVDSRVFSLSMTFEQDFSP
jgi:phage-related protein